MNGLVFLYDPSEVSTTKRRTTKYLMIVEDCLVEDSKSIPKAPNKNKFDSINPHGAI